MVDINGYEIKSAFSGGEPLKAIYSLGEKVWPVAGPEPITWGGLKFTALEAGTIGMTHNGTNATTTKPRFDYSKDGVNWTRWDYSTISVNKGDVICFKGNNGSISKSLADYSEFNFRFPYKISASGNIMSLLYGDDYEGKISLSGKNYCFYKLFYGCKYLTNAPELPATTLATRCYDSMFYDCTSLIKAPELPATKLATYCYSDMFNGCSSLTTAPKILPATTLTNSCYENMFWDCTSLTTAPELPSTTLASSCYSMMFTNCYSLTTAPKLPATSLYDMCYYHMFEGCTSLTTAPELPATRLTTYCYSNMFYGCTNLNYVKANFKTEPSTDYTEYWLAGVSKTGTFVANPSATWPDTVERNWHTVPSGWSIVK